MTSLTTQLERSLWAIEIARNPDVALALYEFKVAGAANETQRAVILVDAILTANRNIELAENVPDDD